MMPKHTNNKTGSGKLMCQECGQECSQVEFYHGLNLCDHLALDAVAVKLKKNNGRRQDLVAISATAEAQKVGAPHCPRCRGLMVTERYVDWESNNDFEGWRCFACGNVWDGVIANNRISVDKRIDPHLPIRPSRHMVQPMSVRPLSGSQKESIRQER